MSGGDTSLKDAMGRFLDWNASLKILEAGCGSMSHMGYPPNAYVVGIDISEKQLRENSLLRERILGDLETFELPQKQFDLIVCWDVLEHLRRPRAAIRHFFGAVKDDGVILLASPNVMTLRGMVTKFTPHWVHVLYARHIVKSPAAGKDGNYPFKSYHRLAIAPKNIARFAHAHGFEVRFLETHQIYHPEHKLRLLFAIWNGLNEIVRTVTLGRIGTDKQECFKLILKKSRPV